MGTLDKFVKYERDFRKLWTRIKEDAESKGVCVSDQDMKDLGAMVYMYIIEHATDTESWKPEGTAHDYKSQEDLLHTIQNLRESLQNQGAERFERNLREQYEGKVIDNIKQSENTSDAGVETLKPFEELKDTPSKVEDMKKMERKTKGPENLTEQMINQLIGNIDEIEEKPQVSTQKAKPIHSCFGVELYFSLPDIIVLKPGDIEEIMHKEANKGWNSNRLFQKYRLRKETKDDYKVYMVDIDGQEKLETITAWVVCYCIKYNKYGLNSKMSLDKITETLENDDVRNELVHEYRDLWNVFRFKDNKK